MHQQQQLPSRLYIAFVAYIYVEYYTEDYKV